MSLDHRFASDAVMVTDTEFRIVHVNPAFSALTGYSRDAVCGQLASSLYELPGAAALIGQNELATLEREGIWTSQVKFKKADGAIANYSQTTVSDPNDQGKASHYVHIIKPVDTGQAESGYDRITQLPNRDLFKALLAQEQENAKRRHLQLGVLLVDVDQFKVFNDSFGYARGDELLGMIARRLVTQVRGNDVIASLGGNQFAVLLTGLAHPEDASIIARKLMKVLEPAFEIEGQEVFVTISTGIVIFPGDGEDSEALLQNAEKSMYSAKAKGRNDYQFFTSSIHSSAIHRLQLESALRKGIEREEFVLHYQPQVDTQTGKVLGMEALIRWQHPEQGMVPPFQFIPVAEETGIIVPIGEWVIYEACRQTREWQERGLTGLTVAVNLSARQFSDRQLLDKISGALERSGLAANCLEIEITESILMQDIERTIMLLEQMSEMGLELSIDDFGTGYSSLNYLKRFPLNKLKIDKSFIDDVIQDKDDAKIVSAIIGLSHNLNLNVISEGVESSEQHDWLREHKCNEIQGYYFSKPLPADAFEAFARERNAL